MKFLILLVILINVFVKANADIIGHRMDLMITGSGHSVYIEQEGPGNHQLDLILDNSNTSEIIIIQKGTGPWSITVDGTTKNWPDAVEIGGICNSIYGCTLILQ